jgi:hypothetical protein
MTAEINIGGVFFPAVLIWCILAFVIVLIMRHCLTKFKLIERIHYDAIFNTCVFVILVGLITWLTH